MFSPSLEATLRPGAGLAVLGPSRAGRARGQWLVFIELTGGLGDGLPPK